MGTSFGIQATSSILNEHDTHVSVNNDNENENFNESR